MRRPGDAGLRGEPVEQVPIRLHFGCIVSPGAASRSEIVLVRPFRNNIDGWPKCCFGNGALLLSDINAFVGIANRWMSGQRRGNRGIDILRHEAERRCWHDHVSGARFMPEHLVEATPRISELTVERDDAFLGRL